MKGCYGNKPRKCVTDAFLRLAFCSGTWHNRDRTNLNGAEMEEQDYLTGRIRDLSQKTYQNDYLTHTEFLTASELSLFYELLRKMGVPEGSREVNHVPFAVYGGREDADRNAVCFLPSYMDPETFAETERQAGEVIALLHAVPVNRKFADVLTHRDYLGALMNLGIERDKIGDILCGEEEACIFVMADMAPVIERELVRIKHTSVQCRTGVPAECTLEPKYEEISGSVASERLDAVLAMVYHLSRGAAQELIDGENVFVDGKTALSAAGELKENARVSVRGHGKFIYEGAGTVTRKGRMFVKVRLYV